MELRSQFSPFSLHPKVLVVTHLTQREKEPTLIIQEKLLKGQDMPTQAPSRVMPTQAPLRTKLLQRFLVKEGKVSMVCNVNPHANYNETKQVLQLAAIAKQVSGVDSCYWDPKAKICRLKPYSLLALFLHCMFPFPFRPPFPVSSSNSNISSEY